MPALKLEDLKWFEPPDEHAMTGPRSVSEWLGALLAMLVFVALALSGLMILISSLRDGWLWLLPAVLLIGLGMYGVFRSLSGILRPAMPTAYSLTNLELRHEQTQGSLGEIRIHGRLRSEFAGKRPQSLTVGLELQPDHHPGQNVWLDSTYCKPDSSGVYEFVLEVPRRCTVLGEVHALIELNFNAQAAFARVMLEPIAQTEAIKLVFQASISQQLAAFEHHESDDLISRTYNGEHASAGWLRHNAGSYFQDFSLEEKSRVFSIDFAQLFDHLEKMDWFADKVVIAFVPPFDGNRILFEAGVYRVVYDQSDEQLTWMTILHQTGIQREAFEAFVLHSAPNSLALRGAMELFELRSVGTGSRPAQSY